MSKRRFSLSNDSDQVGLIEENEKLEFVAMKQDTGTTQQETWLIK